MASSVDEEALHQLYLWVDNIPLSRPKRNLSRDFSDGGVLCCVFSTVLSLCMCNGLMLMLSFLLCVYVEWEGVASVFWDFDGGSVYLHVSSILV